MVDFGVEPVCHFKQFADKLQTIDKLKVLRYSNFFLLHTRELQVSFEYKGHCIFIDFTKHYSFDKNGGYRRNIDDVYRKTIRPDQ